MITFHQMSRYNTAMRAVNTMRTSPSHRILEIGSGSQGILASFLPDDDIVFSDIKLSDEALADPRFVLCDVTNMNYDDNSFDFVIALDVLEHIPPEKRLISVQNICRVAKEGIVITFPHFSPVYQKEDEELRSFYKATEAEPPIWINEHIDQTLPIASEIVAIATGILGENNCYNCFAVRRSLMHKMLLIEAVASQYSQVAEYFSIMNDTYNKTIVMSDYGGDINSAMKFCLFGSKKGFTSEMRKQLETLFASEPLMLDSFEKEVEQNFIRYLQLSSLSLIKQSDAFAHLAFEVLNGKTQESIGWLDNNLKESIGRLDSNLKERIDLVQNNLNIFRDKMNTLIPDIPLLDVILITYNQSLFIEETVQSVLSQIVNFKYRIIVADDCSTDDTVEKIKRLAENSPVPFVFLQNTSNLGIMHNYQRAFSACTSEFVAIIEGDDIWTDRQRLQKHVDFLRAHSECSMSFNRYIVKNFEEGTFHLQPRFSAEVEKQAYHYVTGHDLAYDNLIGNFSTCVYRNSSIKSLPTQLFDMDAYDWLTNILISRMGYIGCLIQPTSIYRIHANGVWSGQKHEERLTRLINTIDVYNKYTDYEFSAGFMAHRDRLQSELTKKTIEKAAEEVLPASKIITIKSKAKARLRSLYKASSFVPPIFVWIIKLFVPTSIQKKIKRICTINEQN